MADKPAPREIKQAYSKDGVDMRTLLSNQTGKAFEQITEDDIDKLGKQKGFSGKQIKGMQKALTQVDADSDYIVSKSGKEFNVFDKNDGAANRSTKKTGNKKGLDVGDIFGVGKNMNLLAGLASAGSGKKDETPVASKEAATQSVPDKAGSSTTAAKPAAGGKAGGVKTSGKGSDWVSGNTDLSKTMVGKAGEQGAPKTMLSLNDLLNIDKNAAPAADKKYASGDGRDPKQTRDLVREWDYTMNPLSPEGAGAYMSTLGENTREMAQSGLETAPLVGGLMKKAPMFSKFANRVMTPAALAGQAFDIAGKAINPREDINWGEESLNALRTATGAIVNKAIGGSGGMPKPNVKPTASPGKSRMNMKDLLNKMSKPTTKNVKLPPVEKSPAALIPKNATPPPAKQVGTFGIPAKPKYTVKGVNRDGGSIPKFKNGGKFDDYAMNYVSNSDWKKKFDARVKGNINNKSVSGNLKVSKGLSNDLTAVNKPGSNTTNGKTITMPQPSTPAMQQVVAEQPGLFSRETTGPKAAKQSGGVSGSDVADYGLDAMKYALPFIGTELAKRQLDKGNKDVEFTPAQLMTGAVTDLQRPNFGYSSTGPVGNDLSSEIVGRKIMSGQQRAQEIAFETQNSASKIAQKSAVIDRMNQGTMYNAQGKLQVDMYNNQRRANFAGAKSQLAQEPWIAAQHMMASDRASGAYMREDRLANWADNVLRNSNDPEERADANEYLKTGRAPRTTKFSK